MIKFIHLATSAICSAIKELAASTRTTATVKKTFCSKDRVVKSSVTIK